MKLALDDLKTRLHVRSVLALTLESGRIAVEHVRHEGGSDRTVRSFALPIGADAVVADPEKAGKELAAHLDTAGIRERRAVVCVPASWALIASAEVPEMNTDDLRGYLELRAEREFPIPVADLRLAHCAFALPDGTRRATVAGIPIKRMEAVERMLAAADCRAASISLGLDGCVPRNRDEAALHFVANGTHVDLVIAAGGGIAAVRTLHGAGSNGTAKFDADSFSREVRITLGRLPETVRQQVREARFSGTPATAEELCIEIRQHLRRMGIDSRLDRAEGDAPAGAAHDAAGQFFRKEPVVFELLPPQVSKWETLLHKFDDRRRRWIVAAVAALIVLPVLAYFIRSRMESSLNAEWNAMAANVTEVEALQQKIRQFRPWFEPAPQALAAVESLTAAFPEAGDVWAKSVQLTEGNKLTCSGFAKSQGALMATLDRLRARPDVSSVQLQQTRGDNPIQFSFTCKWSAHDAK
jgi:Tfp pilus assembly protein PilN